MCGLGRCHIFSRTKPVCVPFLHLAASFTSDGHIRDFSSDQDEGEDGRQEEEKKRRRGSALNMSANSLSLPCIEVCLDLVAAKEEILDSHRAFYQYACTAEHRLQESRVLLYLSNHGNLQTLDMGLRQMF